MNVCMNGLTYTLKYQERPNINKIMIIKECSQLIKAGCNGNVLCSAIELIQCSYYKRKQVATLSVMYTCQNKIYFLSYSPLAYLSKKTYRIYVSKSRTQL